MQFEVNGREVFAATGGQPFDQGKPVVIFLHGSGLDHTFWGLQSRFFAFRNYAVLVPDLPGHDHSEGPAPASIEQIGDWLHDVSLALAIENISVVAHSQGCLNALEFVSRHPERIRSLSRIASGLATPVNAALIEAAEHNPQQAVAMMVAWGFGAAGHLHRGAIPGHSMSAAGRKVMLRNIPDALATDLKACNAYRKGKQAASAIDCPVQVMIAGKDRMAPAKATSELIDYLHQPEVHHFPDCGHMIPLEAPDRCRRALKDFIFVNNPAMRKGET